MSKYVLGHHLKGEGTRLALISELLDPMHRRYIEALKIVRPGARTLEVGCGNGSISAWLAKRVSPGGKDWTQTISELRNDLTSSGKLNDALVDAFLGLYKLELVDSDYRLHRSARPCARGVIEAGHGSRVVVILRQSSNFPRCNVFGRLL